MSKVTDEAYAVEAMDTGMVVRTRSELQRFQEQIVAFRDQLERGEGVDASAVKSEVGKLLGLLESCQKAENRLEAARREKHGIGLCGYALDLNELRASIGCKLNRLRPCCKAG